jgi:hypothetical protein
MQELAVSRERLRRIDRLMAGIAVAFVYSMLIGLYYLMFVDTEPPFHNSAVITKNVNGEPQSVFRPGDTMRVQHDLCFDRDAPVTFGRSLSCVLPSGAKVNVNINTTSGMLRKGCVSNDNVLPIPSSTPAPATCRFTNVVQYSNNPFQNGAITLPEPVIEIVP